MATLLPVRSEAEIATVPALQLQQSHHRLFLASFNARDLVRLTTVDYYRSNLQPDDDTQGYQRPPERSRITRIGTYLLKELGDGLFPTAVVLAARQPIAFDSARQTIRLSPKYPLQVIDGQHRVAGLRYAIEEKGHEEFGDFMVPAVIVEVADRVTEMNQFRIINGTAKSVRTDLVNSILTATASARGEEAIKDVDRWKVVITKVVDRLNRESASNWKGRVIMPDETGLPKAANGKIVRATSFMTSLKPIYVWMRELGFFQGMDTDGEAERIAAIIIDYWNALSEVNPEAFSEPHEYVIQKTPGLFALHLLLQEHLLPVTYRARRSWSKETFVDMLKESPEITDPRFWHVGEGRASAYGSMKGFSELADLLIQSVQPTP
jgi:DGQHR domain-containing protein